jgi:hypothetical protein
MHTARTSAFSSTPTILEGYFLVLTKADSAPVCVRGGWDWDCSALCALLLFVVAHYELVATVQNCPFKSRTRPFNAPALFARWGPRNMLCRRSMRTRLHGVNAVRRTRHATA